MHSQRQLAALLALLSFSGPVVGQRGLVTGYRTLVDLLNQHRAINLRQPIPKHLSVYRPDDPKSEPLTSKEIDAILHPNRVFRYGHTPLPEDDYTGPSVARDAPKDAAPAAEPATNTAPEHDKRWIIDGHGPTDDRSPAPTAPSRTAHPANLLSATAVTERAPAPRRRHAKHLHRRAAACACSAAQRIAELPMPAACRDRDLVAEIRRARESSIRAAGQTPPPLPAAVQLAREAAADVAERVGEREERIARLRAERGWAERPACPTLEEIVDAVGGRHPTADQIADAVERCDCAALEKAIHSIPALTGP
jgi:hypothetical protein